MSQTLLHHRVIGNGPPLLCVHGWGVSFTIWRELVPLLSPHYKLILPEMPGIGQSPLPQPGNYYKTSALALEELRLALDIPAWHVLGYSLGGWIAREYARCYPGAVNKLIFLCLARPLPIGAASLAGLVWLDRRFPVLGDRLLSGRSLRTLVRILGFNGKNHPLVETWSGEIGSHPLPVIKACLQDLPGYGRANLDLPALPTRYIWGRTDGLGVAPLRPGAQDVILPGNHALPMLGAEKIAAMVREFLTPGVVTPA